MSDAHNVGSYSRELGSASYRKRRRRSTLTRVVVATILIVIIGGASYLFGKQFIDVDSLPFALPGVEPKESAEVNGQEEVVPTTVQPASISVVEAGDVVLDGSATESGRQESGAYEFDHLFTHLKREIAPFDVRIVAQEAALAGQRFGFGAESPLNAPQDLGRAEQKVGFNVVLRANEHTLDTGGEGIHNELVWWHDNYANMPVLGIADPEPENNPTLSDYVSNVYMYTKDGFKVAILNHSTENAEENEGMVSRLTDEKIKADVAEARRQGAEMIIACPHWGEVNNPDIIDEEEHYAQVYAEQGVDLILGTHPRVLQPVEVLETSDGHKTVCFYSLGCLISSLNDNNLLGGLAEVTLSRNDRGECEVSSAALKPVITHRGNGEEYCTYLLSDYSDELAWNGWDGWLTPDELNRRCEELYGNDYDDSTCTVKVNLGKTTKLSSNNKSEDEEKDQEGAEEEEQPEEEW